MSKDSLRAAYRALEEEAGDYADAGRALTTLRRRRSAAAAGTALAVLAVLVMVSGLWPTRQESSVIAGPVHAVGRSIHTACMHGCPTFLTYTDGRQVSLGEQTPVPPGNLTLSPDGRWLGIPVGDGFEVRDLTGDTVYRTPSAASGEVIGPWAWSADSRTLLLASHASGDVSAYYLLDLTNGRISRPEVPKGFEPVGLSARGPVLFEESQYGKRATRVRLVVAGRETVLDGRDVELINQDGGPALEVRGDRIYARVVGKVIEFDLDGVEVSRYEFSGRALGPGPSGYLVFTDGKVATASGAVLYELPKESLISVPGRARH
ncbi:hypothetical protein AB0395_05670 [Streptosporangium sp. NPDC051023]|uniref:hypothetical protein n=1 Tax=Streptosporangium sp. NPDC051023 TaxID=3155410 RepID=UPI00344E1354